MDATYHKHEFLS